MSNKKNIDRLFQEKFKDFEVAPNDAVWSRISKDLPNNKKKRRVIGLWWQIGGVAAAIAILLTVGVSVFNSSENKQELPIVDVEQKDKDNNEPNINTNKSSKEVQNDLIIIDSNKNVVVETTTESESNSIEEDDNIYNSPQPQKLSQQLTSPNNSQLNSSAIAENSKGKENQKETSKTANNVTNVSSKVNTAKVASNTKGLTTSSKNAENNNTRIANTSEINTAISETIQNNKTAVTDNTKSNSKENSSSDTTETKDTNDKETQTTIAENSEKQSIEDAIAENTKATNEKEDKESRWSIAPNVAPVYFGSLGDGSPINDQFVGNSKSSDINMSYGITGSYAVSKRLKVRAGINSVNLNHLTTDVIAFTGTEALMRGENTQMANVKYKNHDHSISFMDAKKYNSISKAEMFNTKIAGEIDQRFGFIEVPLELEYRLLDKKFGVNVIGGFSTFFLSNNEIYADIDGISTLIGEANNINSTSFSANFGLGLDYSLSKHWNINLEPQFKYQLNTFNNTSGNFRPFFIGVYTGLSFKF